MSEEKSFRERVEEIRNERNNEPVSSDDTENKSFRERVEEIRESREEEQPKPGNSLSTQENSISETGPDFSMSQEWVNAEQAKIDTGSELLKFANPHVAKMQVQGDVSYLIQRNTTGSIFEDMNGFSMSQNWFTAPWAEIETKNKTLLFEWPQISKMEVQNSVSYMISGQPDERERKKENNSDESESTDQNNTRVFRG